MRHIARVLNGANNPFDPDELDRDYRIDQAHEEALRQRYPDAIFHQDEFDARATQHRIRFSPFARPHHRAAVLDYLDNPAAPTHLTAMHATWFQALDENGEVTFTKAHPVNRAQFMITYRDAIRRGYQLEDYRAERANWTTEQWLNHERQEREESVARSKRFEAGYIGPSRLRDYRLHCA